VFCSPIYYMFTLSADSYLNDSKSCDCHIVLADKKMVLRANISRYVGAYPIFRMPASYLFSRNLPLPISTRCSCNCLLCAIHINCCSYLFSFILSTNNRDLFVPLQNTTRELLSKHIDRFKYSVLILIFSENCTK